MKVTGLRSLTFAALLPLLPIIAQAHPGHDEHELTWDIGAALTHPLTSYIFLTVVGLLALTLGFCHRQRIATTTATWWRSRTR